MNWRYKWLASVSVVFLLAAFSCSKEKCPDKETGAIKTSTQQATEAIEEYGKRPIEKAQKTQSLGEDRTGAIDEATQNLDRR